MNNNSQIILASGSPRRIEMFEKHGLDVTLKSSGANETIPYQMNPHETAMFLALKKGLFAENALSEKESVTSPLIISADTIVYEHEYGIMGKPKNKKELLEMLSSLDNQSHLVITGVAMIYAKTRVRKIFCETTKVYFSHYSEEEMESYSDTSEPYDKAGGYAIQGAWSRYIDHIEGDCDNVIGFPWARFEKEFSEM